MNAFIKLNSKLFEYIDQSRHKFDIDSKLSRTLDGTGTKDYITTKYRYSFSFEVDERQLARLESIYDTHTTIALIDQYNLNKNVIWINDFNPQYIGDGFYSLQVELEEK